VTRLDPLHQSLKGGKQLPSGVGAMTCQMDEELTEQGLCACVVDSAPISLLLLNLRFWIASGMQCDYGNFQIASQNDIVAEVGYCLTIRADGWRLL
jgi:hypothetical protein